MADVLNQDIRVLISDRKNVAADRLRPGQRVEAMLRVERHYEKHLASAVREAAERLSLRTIQSAQVVTVLVAEVKVET